jgi:hypothetical protein
MKFSAKELGTLRALVSLTLIQDPFHCGRYLKNDSLADHIFFEDKAICSSSDKPKPFVIVSYLADSWDALTRTDWACSKCSRLEEKSLWEMNTILHELTSAQVS